MSSAAASDGLPQEEALVALLREGDEATFAALLDAWSPSMFRVARSIVATPESARDAVQETWLAVVGALARFEGRSSLRTWVFRILVNTARSRARIDARETTTSFVPETEDFAPAVDPSRFRAADPWRGHWVSFPTPWPAPEELALDREWVARLAEAVEELPPRQRAVILLRDVEGHTSQDVCQILDVTPTNQRVLLHRARASVRARLEEYFGADDHPETPDAARSTP